jgi:quercetin dioxygenase-like cupin family protein
MQRISSELQKRNYQDGGDFVAMVASQGMGLPLVAVDKFGADILRFEPGHKTLMHTHPGDHILFVVKGAGFLIFDGEFYKLSAGDCYFVPGSVPHQVGATIAELLLLSVANNHRPVDSKERLNVV